MIFLKLKFQKQSKTKKKKIDYKENAVIVKYYNCKSSGSIVYCVIHKIITQENMITIYNFKNCDNFITWSKNSELGYGYLEYE